MSLGSFLKGVVAQVNPFDNGRTYGSYNRPKKRLQPGDPGYVAPVRTQTQDPNQSIETENHQKLQAQRPENLFAGLNQNLKLPGAPNNTLQVNPNASIAPILKPQPGTIVQPTHQAMPAPVKPGWTPQPIGTHANVAGTPGTYTAHGFVPDNQPHPTSLLGHVGNALKTAGQTAVGTVANAPELGLAALRLGTGIVQGLGHIPSVAVHGATYIPRKIAGDDSALNRGLSSINRGVDTATHYTVDNAFDPINRGLDLASKSYANAVPMAAGGQKVYTREQIPLNILAALLTAGTSTAASKAGQAGRVGRVSQFLNKPRVSNTENVIAKTGRTVNKAAPIAHGVMSPVRTTKAGITRLINGRAVPTVDRAAVDAGEVGNVLSDAQLQDLTQPPTQVPVTQTGGGNTPIPVGVPRPNPIRELGGDRPGTVRIPTPDEVAAQKAADRFQSQPAGRPDQRIQGVGNPVTKSDIADAKAVIDDNLVTGKISEADHADLTKQLENIKPTDAPVPKGQKITVKQATGIPVEDKTVVPTDLPETPGTVRVTTSAQPMAAKSEAAASAPVVATPPALPTEVQNILDHPKQFSKRQVAAARNQRRLAKQLAKTKADTQAVVDNMPGRASTTQPALLNVGLNVGDKVNALTEADVINALKSKGVDVLSGKTVMSNSEPTFVPALSRPMTPAEVHDVSSSLGQQAIAHSHNGEGFLAGPEADKWGNFDPNYFYDQSGKTLADVAPQSSGTPGFVRTGELRKGVNGNVSEVAHQSTEAAQAASDTATMSAGDVLAKANQEIAQNGLMSPESMRNLQAMIESGRFTQASPEYRAMAKTLYGAGSDYGRTLSLFNPTMRRTASGDQLANRFISKLYGVAEDPSKLTDAHFTMVNQAENNFTTARDAANQALDRYNATKSAEDFNAWKQARQAADNAEKESLITEYRVANQVLKGNKDPNALKAIQQAEKEAGVYQMDWIDSSMLSGTGTFARNYVNTSLVRMENRLFGGRSYSSRGAKLGNQAGNRSLVSDFHARNELDQNKLSKFVKQWSTTGNTFGEGNIRAVGSARAYKYYADQLKAKGVTGDQLKRDTEVMLHTDPDGEAARLQEWSLKENALLGGVVQQKVEQSLVNILSGGSQSKIAQTAAKAIVRLTVGFPTVIGRSLYGGAKRATVGVPELLTAGYKFAKGDPQAARDLLYSAKVHAGSGATLYALGTVLASSGHITPSYPTDKAEQARWKRDGIQPNSIKIGGQWFGIPGYFGALALPLIIPANIKGKNSPADIAKGIVSGLQDLSPTSGIINFIDGAEGRNGKQWVKNEVASLTRAFTPMGSFLNEIAKMTDPTKNDTTTKDAIGNILDAIAGGIPGLNNAVNKIPATDDNGNVLHNPNPIATALGAQGSEQPQGQQDTQEAQNTANQTYDQLKQSGIIDNKNLMGLVDPKIQAQIKRGEDLKPEQVDAIKKAVVKGVDSTGEDTVYLEKGQYDTNLAVLGVKRSLMAADPTTKPSDLKQMDTNIKRSQVYRDNKISYDLVDAYKSTSLTDWRDMGDPKSDSYDPEMYQKLWNIDQTLAKADASYAKGDTAKQKFSAKKPGKGRSGVAGGYSAEFGTLKAGRGAPNVQQYQTIDQQSGVIPHIAVTHSNIVHPIKSS